MDGLMGMGAGFLLGAIAVAGLMVVVMRRMMVVEMRSPHDVDTTLALLQQEVQSAGWTSPGTWDLSGAATKHGVQMGRDVTNLSICKAEYAKRVLDQTPKMSVMMPCTFSVYTKGDGQTYVAKLNTGMMGRMMGGEIAKVMGGHVAREEEQMLDSLTTAHAVTT